jgi:hypothetical protein
MARQSGRVRGPRFGPDPDVDAVYEEITGLMQQTLDRLAAQRRWPVIG